MALKPEQRKIVDLILREGRHIRNPQARRIYERAAVQTGIVESGLRNLRYGHADSQGWRQERASLYANPTNVRASVRRFRQEFQQQYDSGERSYQVAAQVQRPRADLRGRYKDVAPRAASILSRLGERGGSQHPGTPKDALGGFDAGNATDLSALIAATLGKPQRPVSSTPPAPSFSARNALPMAGTPIQSSGGPAPKGDLSSVLDQIRVQGQSLPQGTTPSSDSRTRQTGVRSKGPGRVAVSPGADRPGVRTRPQAIRFAREISSVAGIRVRIGTGTNHSQMTVSGNVSAHWTGRAVDIPARGRRLIRLGQAALIAAGMPEKQARKQTGGLFNVNGKQIIFNTQEGGDHTDHLHAGL